MTVDSASGISRPIADTQPPGKTNLWMFPVCLLRWCAKVFRRRAIVAAGWAIVLGVASLAEAGGRDAKTNTSPGGSVAVGPQYDATHVYVSPAEIDAFAYSFAATFDGKPSKGSVVNVLPVPSSAEFQYLLTPVGSLSIFWGDSRIARGVSR
jgi:hypothetical protein